MKTLFACFGILVLAVLLGKLQGSRIENLERKIESNRSQQTMKTSVRENRTESSSYRSKYERRSVGAEPSEVYEKLLVSILNSTSGMSGIGPGADSEQREALQEIMQLDFEGIQSLMESVYQSEELKWVTKHMAANLCMVALVDADPAGAFRYIMENEGWNRLFNKNQIPDFRMVNYILTRMAVDDPQLSIDSMRNLENTPKALTDASKGDLLKEVAKTDTDLALQAIVKLPEAQQQTVLVRCLQGLDTKEELAALFTAARERLSSPEQLKSVLSFVLRRSSESHSSAADSQKWLENLEMKDSEKQLIFESVTKSSQNDYLFENPENLRWFASFIPQSSERDEFLWRAVNFIHEDDPEKAYRLAIEVGIDPEEQIRLDREASLKYGN